MTMEWGKCPRDIVWHLLGIWYVFFFYFHITDYFLDTMLVFQHPTPASSTTGIFHQNDGERWGNERGYEENAQEMLYDVTWACSWAELWHQILLYIDDFNMPISIHVQRDIFIFITLGKKCCHILLKIILNFSDLLKMMQGFKEHFDNFSYLCSIVLHFSKFWKLCFKM